MSSQPISNMTLEELNRLIEDVVDRRLQTLLKPQDSRTTEEILDYIDQHRIKPPKGTKSTLEMIREDRDA